MILAVKFYKDVPNPQAIPSDWPARCIELDDDATVPDGYVGMTPKEYEQYKELHRASYEAWEELIHKPNLEKQAKREKAIEMLRPMAEAAQALLDDGETISKDQEKVLNKYKAKLQEREAES